MKKNQWMKVLCVAVAQAVMVSSAAFSASEFGNLRKMRKAVPIVKEDVSSKKKILYVVLDGLPDGVGGGLKELDRKTPLQKAKIPNLDSMAKAGRVGLVHPVKPGYAPESDEAILHILGYGDEAYPGRGIIEVLGIGEKMPEGGIAMRVNFATGKEKDGGLDIFDRRAGRNLGNEAAAKLAKEINAKVKLSHGAQFKFVHTVEHRGILILWVPGKVLNPMVSNTDPGYRRQDNSMASIALKDTDFQWRVQDVAPTKGYEEDESAKLTAELWNEFTQKAYEVLEDSDVNKERIADTVHYLETLGVTDLEKLTEEGVSPEVIERLLEDTFPHRKGELKGVVKNAYVPPANLIIGRNASGKPGAFETLEEKFGLKGAAIVQMPVEMGIAKMTGMEAIEVPPTSARPTLEELQENYGMFIKAIKENLDEYGLLYAHIKGPDIPGHDRDAKEKVRIIEAIDEYFIKPLLELDLKDTIVVVTADHTTSAKMGGHTGDPVPTIIYAEGLRPDFARTLSEKSAARQVNAGRGIGEIQGTELLPMLLKLAEVEKKEEPAQEPTYTPGVEVGLRPEVEKYLYEAKGVPSIAAPFVKMMKIEEADGTVIGEVMVRVKGDASVEDMVRIPQEVFHKLKKVLKEKGYDTNVGTDGVYHLVEEEWKSTIMLQLVIEAAGKDGRLDDRLVIWYGRKPHWGKYWEGYKYGQSNEWFYFSEGGKNISILRLSDYTTVQALVEDVVKRKDAGEEVALALEENETADDTIVHLSIALGVPLMYSPSGGSYNAKASELLLWNAQMQGAGEQKREIFDRIDTWNTQQHLLEMDFPGTTIMDVRAWEILDSRGNPTVAIRVVLYDGSVGWFYVPSGASTGEREALELRDGDKKRYLGKGVRRAVENINTVLREKLIGEDAADGEEIIKAIVDLDKDMAGDGDGINKRSLGANASLVEIAVQKALAKSLGKEYFEYIQDITGTKEPVMPLWMMNVLNGGAHADNNVDIQEFMVIGLGKTFRERYVKQWKVFHALGEVLKEKGYGSSKRGNEGGYPPNLQSNEEALEVLMEAIKKAGLTPGKDIVLAIDAAASEFHKEDGNYHLEGEGEEEVVKSALEMIDMYGEWVLKYPIVSIEDGFGENDDKGWKAFTWMYKDWESDATNAVGFPTLQIVGDDFFVTQTKIFKERGIDKGVANSILIKVNQIGTITETLEAVEMAQANGYTAVISHRSGETIDDTISDIAVGTGAGQIKPGATDMARIVKANRLLWIEAYLEGRIKKPAYNPDLPLSAITNASAIEVVDGNGRSAVHIDIWLNSGKRVSAEMSLSNEYAAYEFGSRYSQDAVNYCNQFLENIIGRDISEVTVEKLFDENIGGNIVEFYKRLLSNVFIRAAAEASGKPLYAYLRENMVASVMGRAAAPRRSRDLDEAI